jgi:hypothetical protein
VLIKDMMNGEEMVKLLRGVDVLVCAVPATKETVTEAEPIWLFKAAV